MVDSADQQPCLVFLIGPPAVGKMTVGQALAELTGFRFFHLHQIADLITDYFDYGSPAYRRLVSSYRAQFFEEAALSRLNLITTGTFDFDDAAEIESFRQYVRAERDRGGTVFVAELLATPEVCLERNDTENRRRHKKTDWATDDYMREFLTAHRWDSGGSLPVNLPLLRIETEHSSAKATAQRIAEHFSLRRMP